MRQTRTPKEGTDQELINRKGRDLSLAARGVQLGH